jgi:hypothetical protein
MKATVCSQTFVRSIRGAGSRIWESLNCKRVPAVHCNAHCFAWQRPRLTVVATVTGANTCRSGRCSCICCIRVLSPLSHVQTQKDAFCVSVPPLVPETSAQLYLGWTVNLGSDFRKIPRLILLSVLAGPLQIPYPFQSISLPRHVRTEMSCPSSQQLRTPLHCFKLLLHDWRVTHYPWAYRTLATR